jgi:hypothetical protein
VHRPRHEQRQDLQRADFPGAGPPARLLKNCRRIAAALALVILGVSPATASAQGSTSSVYSPLNCPGVTKLSAHVHVRSAGTLSYNSRPIKFTGYTFYPADDGGAPAWRQSVFTSYVDKTLANEAYLGANLVRPTDQFDNLTSGQKWDDRTVWANMDHLVCQSAQQGTFVELDLSFMAHVLSSQGKNVLNAANWLPMIDAVAKHYAGWQSIAWVSFYGEPTYPTTAAQVTTLRAFYTTLLGEYHKYDPARALTPGGLTHTMYGYPGWWQIVASVPYANIFAYKVYDLDDENYLPTIYGWTSTHGRALINEEFGMPQSQGDGTWSGQTFNGLQVDRADFYSWNYQQQSNGRTQASIFWNDSCLVGPTNYDVNPGAGPAVIAVIRANAAVHPTSSKWSGWSC